MRPALTGHERIDQRSLALHRAIANKLQADPRLLGIARDNIARWWAAAGGSRPYRPMIEIAALLVEDSEHTRTLRRNTDAEILSRIEHASLSDLNLWAVRAYSASTLEAVFSVQ